MELDGTLLQFFAEGEGGEGGEGAYPPPASREPPFQKGAESGAGAEDDAGAGSAGGEAAYPPPASREPPFQKGAEDSAGAGDAAREMRLRAHFDGLWRQAAALRELVPDFDLGRELEDPEFVRRTAPGAMSVEDAWFSLHHRDYLRRQREQIARRAREEAAAAVRSGSVRPRENGSAGASAVMARPDLRQMTQRERRDYIMRKYPREMG